MSPELNLDPVPCGGDALSFHHSLWGETCCSWRSFWRSSGQNVRHMSNIWKCRRQWLFGGEETSSGFTACKQSSAALSLVVDKNPRSYFLSGKFKQVRAELRKASCFWCISIRQDLAKPGSVSLTAPSPAAHVLLPPDTLWFFYFFFFKSTQSIRSRQQATGQRRGRLLGPSLAHVCYS